MGQNDDAPHAGCVGAPEASAGCVEATGSRPAGADAPPDAPGSAGCAPDARADSSEPKATPPATVREFERALRTLGFTRQQAARIARQGFDGAQDAPADGPSPADLDKLNAAAERLLRILKG